MYGSSLSLDQCSCNSSFRFRQITNHDAKRLPMQAHPAPTAAGLPVVRMLLLCFLFPVVLLAATVEKFVVVKDELYLESYYDQVSILDRSTASKSKVLVKSSRDQFYDIFSTFENYKDDLALWTSSQNGRRTLSKMKYTICPVVFADEVALPANVPSMISVMQSNKEFYERMSWMQHDVTWEFLNDLKLVNLSASSEPTRDQVADACLEYMENVYNMKYPDTQTGVIVAYNPTQSGDMSWGGGIAFINYNITWMALRLNFEVTRHELGHNYGHPHHFAYTYGWRFLRGFESDTFDGFDMMSSGNGGQEAHLSAASKYFFNWMTKDAVITMQPEGSSAACPACTKSITKIVLKPFDRSDIVPSASNLMAVHIPVLGVGKHSTYSYWLSYRSNYTDARNGLSMHIVRFNLGGMFGATFDSLNFDAHGDTSTTEDSFVLNGTCYVMQPPGLLMDIDRTAVEQIQPVVCVNDIDKGKSITISASFLNEDIAPQVTFKKQNALTCSNPGSDFGLKNIDMTSSKVHLLEYNGTGQDGNITFSACLAAGSGSVKAYFYDSYPYAYLSYKAPPSYGAFLNVSVSIACSTGSNSVTSYSSENGQTFVLVIADGQVSSGTTLQYSSTCKVKKCHVGQYMDDDRSICLNCPEGYVSLAGSVSLDSCISCIADGLEPVGTPSKDCKISLKANPALNTGKSWRVLLPAVQSETGYSADVDELEFYASDDCSDQTKISTAGGIAFSSGYYSDEWRSELAFNEWWRWGGRPDSRDLLYLGITFNRTVTVNCIKYIQPALMVKELRIQAKPENEENWNNVLIVRSIPNETNIIPIVVVPTSAPTNVPTAAPTTRPGVNTCSSPENVCRGGLFRLFRSGQTMHRKILGMCQERCSSFTLFRGFTSLFGWKCGSCP